MLEVRAGAISTQISGIWVQSRGRPVAQVAFLRLEV